MQHEVVRACTVCLLFALVLSIASLSPMPASASDVLTPAETLERLLTAETLQSDWFTDEFLVHAAPADEVGLLLQQLTNGLGSLQRVEAKQPPHFEAIYEKGVLDADIALDDSGRIALLRVFPPRRRVSGFDDLLVGFAELPGTTSVLIWADGAPVAEHNTSQPLAVGSTFKLAVLAALLSDMEEGAFAWDDVAELKDEWRSLPSGLLQEWPPGSPLTLHTLAAHMISISDNTAADALIHIIGRDKVAQFSPRNDPFLTTREFFTLKNPANADVLQQYREANAAERRGLLATLYELPPVAAHDFVAPTARDVEWFFTAEEACAVMAHVQHVPVMSINPGYANPDQWARVSFKGGSEPGVVNATTWLIAESGTEYCVSATWNDANNLDVDAFDFLYAGILQAILLQETSE